MIQTQLLAACYNKIRIMSVFFYFQEIINPVFLPGQIVIDSHLLLEYNADSDEVLQDSAWHCELTYQVLNSPMYTVTSPPTEINSKAGKNKM